MSREDFVYMCLLFGSIPFGYIVKLCPTANTKKHVIFMAGLFVVFMTVGLKGSIHSFLTILGTYLMMKALGSKYGPWSSFIFTFIYLFFFRTCHWFGFNKPPPYSNAIQLLVTLRMCTIAFEGFQIDSTVARTTTKLDYEMEKDIKISLYDIFAYGWSYCGLLTGPYYRFTTYIDLIHQQNSKDIPTVKKALERLKYIPFYGAVYLPLNSYFPINHIGSSEYMNHPWGYWYKLAYLVPTFLWFRWRFHIGWTLAESSCIMMGLGAYPEQCKPKPGQGPTVEINVKDEIHKDIQYNFDAIHNIKVYEIEMTPNMSVTMKNWNMTVQWWLSAYVNRKLPFKNRKLRMVIVLLVSAFWHGVKPGYYLCFMSVPLIVFAELSMERVFQPSPNSLSRKIFDWLNWFFLYRMFEYLSISFMFLEIAPILKVWTDMYFFMHIIVILLICVSFFFPKRKTTEKVYEKTIVEENANIREKTS